MISVETIDDQPASVTVRVRLVEGNSSTTHEVTVARADLERLGRKGETAGAFVSRCFTFLLEREPKESILKRFNITVIGRYFPEFERAIRT